MTRLPAFAALIALAAAPGLAAAQTQDCLTAGLLTIDSVESGTQRVPRDPRSGRDLVTISAGVRNLSTRQVTFTVSYSGRMAQDFVTGQSWTLPAGQRTYFAIANVFKPAPANETVRASLRLSCN